MPEKGAKRRWKNIDTVSNDERQRWIHIYIYIYIDFAYSPVSAESCSLGTVASLLPLSSPMHYISCVCPEFQGE